MTAMIVFLIGLGLICNTNYWAVGIVLVLCSAEIMNKDSTISSLRSRLAGLGAHENEEGAEE